MKALLLTLPLALTASCVTVAPEPNPWTEQERVSTEAVYPLDYPELDPELGNLEAVLEAALGNFDIAEANAQALEELSRAYNATLDAGEAEFELGHIYQRQLRASERGRWMDRAIFGFVGIVGLAIGLH